MIERQSIPGLVALLIAFFIIVSFLVGGTACDERFETCKAKADSKAITRSEPQR